MNKSVVLWTSLGLLTGAAIYYLLQNKRAAVENFAPEHRKPVDATSPIRKYMHKAKVTATK